MKRKIALVAIVVLSVLIPLTASELAGVDHPVAVAQTVPPPRYQVIDDLTTQQTKIDALERKVKTLETSLDQANNQIAGLTLLREHDVQMAGARRAEDQKRIRSLEWNMNMLFDRCR